MSLFVLDTGRDESLLEKEASHIGKNVYTGKSKSPKGFASEETLQQKYDEDFGGLPPPDKDISHIINKYKTSSKKKCKEKADLDNFVRSMGWNSDIHTPSSSSKGLGFIDVEDNIAEVDVGKLLKGNQMQGIEKKHNIAAPTERKRLKLMREERDKTKGKNWFNMPATEVTEEIENDLKILQMRSVLDPKHFYKKNDLKVLPKYFQIGKVEPSPLDYYNERDVRKSKKKSLVEELLADADFQKFNKRKFKEVMEKKQKTGYRKAYKKMKKLKKKK